LTLAITVASGSTPRLPGLIGCLPPWPSPPRPVGLWPSSRRMRGVPAQDGSSDSLLATPPGGSLRARCATTDVRTAQWPLTGR